MKRIVMICALLSCALLIPVTALCQHKHTSGETKQAALLAGLGQQHHPVSTTNPEAQRFFDQGLTLIYAFNHDEAIRSFKRAAELDPNLAMAHWGIALALGPNINLDVDLEREKAAYEAAQKALALATKAPEHERAYITALVKRYSIAEGADLKKLALDYKNAMGELIKRYPDDLDAATLYAESAMNLRPWQLWSSDGNPAEGTLEILAVLESVLKRNPDHIGANHYYIHAVEASPNPERAFASAMRLMKLAPAAGHLVHMPAHIFMRMGDYAAASRSNEVGAEADRAYIKATGARGVYPMMYYSHNLHFLAVARSMEGRFEDAKEAAEELASHLAPLAGQDSMVDSFLATPTLILVRFHRWDDVLKLPEPNKTTPITNALWHLGRALAYAATGRVDMAEAERNNFIAAKKNVAAEASWGINNANAALAVAENFLMAKLALAKKDNKSAIESFKKAIEAEDALRYDEPPAWYIPCRESLGAALLSSGDYAAAEQSFRADLERNPRSGRSLFGLLESLKAQGKTASAQMVQREFEAAWKNADTQIRAQDL